MAGPTGISVPVSLARNFTDATIKAAAVGVFPVSNGSDRYSARMESISGLSSFVSHMSSRTRAAI